MPPAKGGIIQRLTAGWDPRGFEVWPIAAPAGIEREQHFLQRFWAGLPADGEDLRVRPDMVWPRAGGARGRLRHRGGMAPRL